MQIYPYAVDVIVEIHKVSYWSQLENLRYDYLLLIPADEFFCYFSLIITR